MYNHAAYGYEELLQQKAEAEAGGQMNDGRLWDIADGEGRG